MNIDAKNIQQNISKLNPRKYKSVYIPWPSGIYPIYARMVQHSKINVMFHINKQTKEMDLTNPILSERRKSQKKTYSVISFI